LDGHQQHQRARWPIRAQGSVDRQRNDRLGRTWSSRHRVANRREILRSTQRDADANANCNSHGNTNSNPYFDTETFTDAETGANA